MYYLTFSRAYSNSKTSWWSSWMYLTLLTCIWGSYKYNSIQLSSVYLICGAIAPAIVRIYLTACKNYSHTSIFSWLSGYFFEIGLPLSLLHLGLKHSVHYAEGVITVNHVSLLWSTMSHLGKMRTNSFLF